MFRYVRPDESFMFGTVTGTVEATYNANWLVNGQPNYPVRGTTGLTLTVTSAARTVSLVAIVNHNLTGTVGISGDVTATVPAATFGADGIAKNSWVAFTPVAGADSIVMTASQTPSIVGELYAGTQRVLERQLLVSPDFDPGEPFAWEGEYGAMAPYDLGLDARRLAGETIVSSTGMADIEAWFQSTRKGTRPTLIIPIDTLNDAWLVTFRYRSSPYRILTDGTRSLYRVRFEFAELPRVRW